VTKFYTNDFKSTEFHTGAKYANRDKNSATRQMFLFKKSATQQQMKDCDKQYFIQSTATHY